MIVRNWKIFIGILLVSLSVLFYVLHYVIFQDAHHIFVFMLHDIAFVPLEVLFVTLIIERLLHHREKRSLLNKLNMLIGAFYSEVGTDLIKQISSFTANAPEFNRHFLVSPQWSDKDFLNAASHVRSAEQKIDCSRGNLEALKEFLGGKRTFLLALLENPNVLEHDAFTDLLWAVFHLTEELAARPSLGGLPPSDCEHLAGDIKRAHARIISEWLLYMKHLKHDYPYLFSLSVRLNPFKPDASPIVV